MERLIIFLLFLSFSNSLTSTQHDLIKYLAVVIRKLELVFCHQITFDQKEKVNFQNPMNSCSTAHRMTQV